MTNMADKVTRLHWKGWAAIGILAAALAGCEKPPGPYVAKSLLAPEVVHCNDYTGHKKGSRPWALGGKCCCTPTDELMEQLHRDGFCTGMTADQLRAVYEQKGIALKGSGHMQCNGLCDKGPHVVLGGRCMCPPTPGTVYYERVIAGPAQSAPAK